MSAKPVKYFLESVAFGLLSLLVQALPLRTVQRLGASLGAFAYGLLGSRRAVTLDNLAKGMPELSPERRIQVAREVFRGIGTALLELLWFPRLSAEGLRALAPYEDTELVLRALAGGRGALFLTAHFGNWEIGAQTVAVHARSSILIIVKPQANPLVDRAVNRRRTQYGCRVVPMGESVRAVLKALEEGEMVGIAADQSAAKESVWVKFFGREVPVHQGPAVFALRTRAPIVLSFAIRQPDGTYRVVSELVEYDDLTENTAENVHELTRRHVERTEAMIRRYPGQWMWTHRRWKTGPEEKPGRHERSDAPR